MDENDLGSGSAHQGSSGGPNDWMNNIQLDIPQGFDWDTLKEEIDAEDAAKIDYFEAAAKIEQLGHQGPDDLEMANQLEELLRNSAPITQHFVFDTTFYDEIVARIEKPTG